MKRDYYEVLGVARDATTPQIKKAYRQEAVKFHPDRNPGDQEAEERFKEAAEAYEVLGDPEKRRLYDQFGHEGPSQAGFTGFGDLEDILSHFGPLFSDFGDFFRRGRRGRQRGADAVAELQLSFMDAVKGATKEVDVERRVGCHVCDGSGAKAGTKPEVCRDCGGRGTVVHRQGIFSARLTCPTCRGQGRIVREKCAECHGSGLEIRSERLKVTVPAGVEDGQSLRLGGKGEMPPGGNGVPGDLYVHLNVEGDPRFTREGPDIYCEIPITFAQAALGASVKVPIIGGETEVQVKPGTQPGHIETLKGEGIPRLDGYGNGDQVIRFMVTVPKKVNPRQRELLQGLAEIDGVQVGTGKRSWFGRGNKKRKSKGKG